MVARHKLIGVEVCQDIAEAVILLRVGELQPLLRVLSENLSELGVACQLREADAFTCGLTILLTPAGHPPQLRTSPQRQPISIVPASPPCANWSGRARQLGECVDLSDQLQPLDLGGDG